MTLAFTSCGGSGSNATATILEGSWVKSCSAQDPNDPDTYYDVITVSFASNRFDSSVEIYTDTGCTIPDALSPNPTASGNFTVGNNLTTTGGLEATELDSQVILSNGRTFNSNDFNIFYITGNILYVGDTRGTNDGSTPALRPDSLDLNRGFDRQ